MKPFQPDYASPPGETIQDLLDELAISVEAFARQLNRALSFAKDLLAGNERITAELARDIEAAIGGPAEFWLARDEIYLKDKERIMGKKTKEEKKQEKEQKKAKKKADAEAELTPPLVNTVIVDKLTVAHAARFLEGLLKDSAGILTDAAKSDMRHAVNGLRGALGKKPVKK